MIFDILFRYFTFISFGINAIKLFTMRSQLSRPIFTFYSLFTSLFLIWGILQFVGGYNSFIFVFSEPLSDPLVALFWIFHFLLLWGTTVWVVWGDGAVSLAESGLIQGPGSTHPLGVKIFFICFSVFFPFFVLFTRIADAFVGFPS